MTMTPWQAKQQEMLGRLKEKQEAQPKKVKKKAKKKAGASTTD